MTRFVECKHDNDRIKHGTVMEVGISTRHAGCGTDSLSTPLATVLCTYNDNEQHYATSSASEKMCTFNLLALSISVIYTALVAVRKGMQRVKLLQQNPPVLNWRCRLTQVVLYSFSFLFRFGTSKERQSIQRSTPGRSLPH